MRSTSKRDRSDKSRSEATQQEAKLRFLTEAQRSQVMERRNVCMTCVRNEGLTALTVKCGGCRCAGISLATGSCRLNKWPTNVSPYRTEGQRVRVTNEAKPEVPTGKQPVVIVNHQSPGDIVALTAAVRDLHRAHGGQMAIQVHTSADSIWMHNPLVRVVRSSSAFYYGSRVIKAEYPAIHQSNQRPIQFIQAFHEDLERKLGVRIPFTDCKGDIYLSKEEQAPQSQIEAVGHAGPIWIMIAGGKYDFTAKWWPPESYQAVVDHFKGRIQFVQCGEAGHWHPPLDGVINLVGKTDLRQFIRLMYHAQGVVCPVTFAMHAAAAVPTKDGNLRPCVVIAGGREPVHWEQYPGHQFIHTIGALACCRNGGCWKSRCQKVGDGDRKDFQDLCEQPVEISDDLRVPRCMHMIEPDDVIRAIERYTSREDHDSSGKAGVAAVKSVGGESDGGNHSDPHQMVGIRPSSRDGGRDSVLTEANARVEMERVLELLSCAPCKNELGDGRGIVIPGGGMKYFPGVWIAIRRLRHLGCDLPIEVWYLGPGEMTNKMRQLVEPLDVRCVDALAIRKRHPSRILRGWELKPYALIHSRFREILLLDADNVPVVDPSFLFSETAYQEHGAVFWPDIGRFRDDHMLWSLTGVAHRDEPEFESGQILIEKARCWRPLQLTMWMNEHSDFWYRHMHGDKDTYRFAWHKCGVSFAMPSKPTIKQGGKVFCQHDFDGRRVFEHRHGAKCRLDKPHRRVEGLYTDDTVRELTHELSSLIRTTPDDESKAKGIKADKREATSRRAFLVYGPESSGTRLMTRILISAGCVGDDGHGQRFDNSPPREESLIVWRRSVPHANGWPDIEKQVESLKQSGYAVHAVVTIRDWAACIPAQIRAGHARNKERSIQRSRRAMAHIFSSLWGVGVPYEVVTYEALVTHTYPIIADLLSRLGLDMPTSIPDIRDCNVKYWTVENAKVG